MEGEEKEKHEEEQPEAAQEKAGGEELTANLSKNEIKRVRKAKRKKEVRYVVVISRNVSTPPLIPFPSLLALAASGRSSIKRSQELVSRTLMRCVLWRRPPRTWAITS